MVPLSSLSQEKPRQHNRIRVAIVGGLDRARAQWLREARTLGVELEHHTGRTAGRGSAEIIAIVRRADLVVIITDPNSHSGVAVARRAATSTALPHVLIKHLRPGDLSSVITSALGAPALAAAP